MREEIEGREETERREERESLEEVGVEVLKKRRGERNTKGAAEITGRIENRNMSVLEDQKEAQRKLTLTAYIKSSLMGRIRIRVDFMKELLNKDSGKDS